MGRMARPLLAVASLAPATALDQDQSGGQNRSAGLKLLEPGLQLTGDEGGMFGDFEPRSSGGKRLGHYGYVVYRIRFAKQNRACEEIFSRELLKLSEEVSKDRAQA